MKKRTIITIGEKSDYYTCKYCKVLLPKENFNVLHHKCFSDVDLVNEDICADPDSFIFRRSKNLEAYETVTERKEKAWSRYDEMLINAMKNRPCLWDYGISARRNPQVVTRAWTEIVAELEDQFDVETIKKRWKNLRDSYNKAKKREKDIALGLINPDDAKREGFRFYKEMAFLSETPSYTSVDNLGFNVDLDEQSCDISTPTDSSKDKPAENVKRKKRRMEATKFQKDLIQFITKSIDPPKEMDRTDGFLLHLGEVMRRLPYRNRRLLEVSISKLVLEAEEECGLLDQS